MCSAAGEGSQSPDNGGPLSTASQDVAPRPEVLTA